MVDLIVVLIILLFGGVGYYKGIVKTVVTLGSSIVALILSFLVYPVINSFLTWTPLYGYIYNWVEKKVGEINFGIGVQTQGQAITEGVTWLPHFLSEHIIKNNNTEIYKLMKVSSVVEYVSTSITQILIGIVAILGTWLLIKILLAAFLKSVDTIAKKTPVISNLNKIGGFAAGILKGLFGIWIVCLLVPLLITHPIFTDIHQEIERSYLTRWLYENNMILQVLNGIINT